MAANTKRLDLRFGSFACSVQGFDDPVMPVQQVLRAIQHLLEETPELADAGIQFDAEAVESLIEEVARRAELASEDIEITPGLVIVHRGENDFALRDFGEALGVETEPGGAAPEAWSRPFSGEAAPAEPSYVNIFGGAAAGGGDSPGDDVPAGDDGAAAADDAPDLGSDPDAEEDIGDVIAARLRGLGDDPAEAEMPRDIFAETDDGGEGGIFVDPGGARAAPAAADAAEEAPLNLFAAGDAIGDGAAAADDNLLAGDLPDDAPDGPAAEAEDLAEVERAGALFGESGARPEAEGDTEGYTVGGLAQAVGATSVDAMMVAAAAWMVLLRGQTAFSRREVMDVFNRIPGDHEKTLEARIKGFGKAVRNGQIIMIQDGVFGLARAELDRFQALL